MKSKLKNLRNRIFSPIISNQDEASTRISDLSNKLNNLNSIVNDLEAVIIKNDLQTAKLHELEREKQVFYATVLHYFRTRHGIYSGSYEGKLISSICRPTEILRFCNWSEITHPDSPLTMHRKQWEYVYIIQALYERGMLEKGKRGLGFAVGTEPLPSFFASRGCDILATDVNPNEIENSNEWIDTNTHSNCLESLLWSHICDIDILKEHVEFQFLNMNNIPDDVKNYDFCWSACAFEHLGSLQHGKDFLINMLECLKPGGVAVHTTEFNLLSNTRTADKGISVIYRECDLIEIVEELKKQGHYVEPLDFRLDNSPADNVVMTSPLPMHEDGRCVTPHIKLELDGFLATSFGLIIIKKS